MYGINIYRGIYLEYSEESIKNMIFQDSTEHVCSREEIGFYPGASFIGFREAWMPGLTPNVIIGNNDPWVLWGIKVTPTLGMLSFHGAGYGTIPPEIPLGIPPAMGVMANYQETENNGYSFVGLDKIYGARIDKKNIEVGDFVVRKFGKIDNITYTPDRYGMNIYSNGNLIFNSGAIIPGDGIIRSARIGDMVEFPPNYTILPISIAFRAGQANPLYVAAMFQRISGNIWECRFANDMRLQGGNTPWTPLYYLKLEDFNRVQLQYIPLLPDPQMPLMHYILVPPT